VSGTSLARGLRVGDRYRLERELGAGTDGITWEATDERLDRPVALRIFGSGLDRRTVVKRAGIAASLTHPRVVRVFDTGEDGGRFFTVSELLPHSLETVRRPVASDEALLIATDVAEALTYAHERGVSHGHLYEANVLLSEGGAKVADFALNHASEHADADDDLRQFGALMRRISRTPDPSAPPGFAGVIEGLGNGAYGTAAEALTDLRALQPKPVSMREAPRSRLWLAVVVALLLGLAAFGAMRLGERSPSQRLVPGGRIDGTPLAIAGIKDFDPFSPDEPRVENPTTVRNATDGNAGTFWSTERYSNNPNFGGLKDGVGLIVDLGKPTDVGKAQVLFASPGCSFQIRRSDDKRAPVGEWATAATINNSPVSAPLEFDDGKAQFWMLWITKLTSGVPDAGSKFACAIKELDFYNP
jgi:serine/threonine protein kinase